MPLSTGTPPKLLVMSAHSRIAELIEDRLIPSDLTTTLTFSGSIEAVNASAECSKSKRAVMISSTGTAPDGQQVHRGGVVLADVHQTADQRDLAILDQVESHRDGTRRDADDHHGAALVDQLDRLGHRTLPGHAVDDDGGGTAEQRQRRVHGIGCGRIERACGAEPFGAFSLGGQQVGDDDLGPGVAQRQQHEQPDGARADHHDGAVPQVADRLGGAADGVHRGGQRLDQDRVVVVECGVQRDDPVDGDGEAVGQPAGGLAAEHQQFPADVVAARAALRAVPAGEVGLDDDAGAEPGVVDPGTDGVDDADHLVPGAVRQVDERVVPARGVGIRTADADDGAADAHLAGLGSGLGHGLEDDVVDGVDDDAAVGPRRRPGVTMRCTRRRRPAPTP